jgi:SAM-dependent methyltransferase
MQKKYGFEKWHIIPSQFRDYFPTAIEMINKFGPQDTVVELGCGFGEILAISIADRKIGIDIDEKIIAAAKLNIFCKGVEFYTKFDEVHDKDIRCLTILNFLHTINPVNSQKIINEMILHFNPKTVLLDVVEGEGYKYHHNRNSLLPESYQIDQIRSEFKGSRTLILYSLKKWLR